MKNIFPHGIKHITRHVKTVTCHLQKHHKKYLFGMFGGFALVKLFLLVFGFSLVSYTTISTFAELESGCSLSWEYYTGEYETWGYLTLEQLTWGYYTGCTTIPWYWTGGTEDEFGVLTGQTWVEQEETWCTFTGETLTWWYMTWFYLTWWYRTWGEVVCEEEQGTGDEGLGNGICESGDIVWSMPLSWSVVRNIFSFVWSYSGTDCLISGLSLQIFDHNNQWITLWTIVSWATSYSFDSQRLYNFEHSGYYNVSWTGLSGQQIYLYTGIYTWVYSRLFTWYQVKLLHPNQTSLYTSSVFTIDNEYPTVTWISLLSGISSSGYLNGSGIVTLNFTANEVLSWLQVTLWSGASLTSSAVSWLLYSYIWNLSGHAPEGLLLAHLVFVDLAGNTWALVYTSSLIFDSVSPTLTGFVFTAHTWWVLMSFSWSEPIRYTSTYSRTGLTSVTGANLDYMTGQQLDFSWLERDQTYTFTLDVYDRANNTQAVTGDILWMASWAVVSHVHLVTPSITGTSLLTTGTLTGLANTLKIEIEKFTACKNALSYSPIEIAVRRNNFVLQMPAFKKSQVKTLVNGFALFVLDKVKKDYKIHSGDIVDITKKFDNFLIILKLLRDDDNSCKQNLSNYYINQFRQALEEYKINLE